MSVPCFVPADILLPAANISLDPWACIAVDQFTSQPEYWQRAEELAAGKPSTLHIVLPEAYLGPPQEEERMQTIRRTMQEYRKSVPWTWKPTTITPAANRPSAPAKRRWWSASRRA